MVSNIDSSSSSFSSFITILLSPSKGQWVLGFFSLLWSLHSWVTGGPAIVSWQRGPRRCFRSLFTSPCSCWRKDWGTEVVFWGTGRSRRWEICSLMAYDSLYFSHPFPHCNGKGLQLKLHPEMCVSCHCWRGEDVFPGSLWLFWRRLVGHAQISLVVLKDDICNPGVGMSFELQEGSKPHSAFV